MAVLLRGVRSRHAAGCDTVSLRPLKPRSKRRAARDASGLFSAGSERRVWQTLSPETAAEAESSPLRLLVGGRGPPRCVAPGVPLATRLCPWSHGPLPAGLSSPGTVPSYEDAGPME